jgi:hypothetical protein
MGDGSASVDLLPKKEVDEDIADDVLDAAVTDAGVEPVVVAGNIGEGVHAVGGVERQLIDLAAACSAVMVLCWPSDHDPLVFEPALFNGARSLLCFDVASFRFRAGD